jgi:hypothetical protein
MSSQSHIRAAAALSSLETKIRAVCDPQVAQSLLDWMNSLPRTGVAADFFTQRSMFPMLQLPEWMAETAGVGGDENFQAGLAYSTINGYYFIRLVDNVMDGHGVRDLGLLPMAAFFHAEFQGVYQRWFDWSHPFWSSFQSLWFASAGAVCRESLLDEMNLDEFRATAAHKLCAAKIPLIAVHEKCGKSTELPAWLDFAQRLAEWWQFLDDLADWHSDQARCRCTYFLSEAQIRRRSGESIHCWVAREGFQWGIDTLAEWMRRLRACSENLHSIAVTAFLDDSMDLVTVMSREILPGLEALRRLANAMEPEPPDAQPLQAFTH